MSDLEIYQRFMVIADELEQLAAQGVSLISSTALKTAGQTMRGMAAAIYEHSLADVDDDGLPQ